MSLNLAKKYDLVVAFQVLQHIKISKLQTAVANICKTSNKSIIVSVPYFSPQYLYFKFRLPSFFSRFRLKLNYEYFFRISLKKKKERVYKNGENSYHAHYWELGRTTMSEETFKSLFENNGFKPVKYFSCPSYPYHHFIVFNKV